MQLATEASKGVRWTSLSSAVTVVSESLRTLILVRFLSPVDFGLMAMVGVVTDLAQMYLDLGISAAIIHRQDTNKDQLSSLYWLNILSGFIVFTVIWLAAPVLPAFFHEPRLLPLLRAVAIVFLISPIAAQFDILLQKELGFRTLSKVEITSSIVCTSAAAVMAIRGWGVWTLVGSYIVAVGFRAFLLSCIGFRRFRPSFHFRTSDLKGYVSFGLFQIGERTSNYLNQRFDQIVMGRLVGTRALGFYSFAFGLSGKPVSRINPILNRVAFPVFSKVQNEEDRLRRGYMKLIRIVASINAPLLVGFAAIARWAVPTVFGKQWAEAVTMVQIMCLISLIRSIENPLGSLQLAKGRADLGFWWNGFQLLVIPPLLYVGGVYGQGIGIALTLLVVKIAFFPFEYRTMIRPLIGKCGWDYAAAFLVPTGMAFAMGLCVSAMSNILVNVPAFVLLGLQVSLGGIVYLGLVLIFQRQTLLDFRSALFSS